MTTETTTASTEELKKFAEDLAEYACSWVDPIKKSIAKHAKEIFEDSALREMIATYADTSRMIKRCNSKDFVDAILDDDPDTIREHTVLKPTLDAYHRVLDDLIFYKYRNS